MSDDLTKEQRQKLVQARRKGRSSGIIDAAQAFLRPGDLAVDCGANVGGITTRLAASGADIVAYEPDPVAFEALTKATADHENVTLHQAAVGITDGSAPLFRGARFEENPLFATRRSSVTPGGNRMDDAGLTVDLVNLPQQLKTWIEERGEIAFLKLDIEGAELEILTDMLRFRLFDSILMTVAELHAYKFPAQREEFAALRKTIEERFPPGKVWLGWM